MDPSLPDTCLDWRGTSATMAPAAPVQAAACAHDRISFPAGATQSAIRSRR